MGRQVEPSLAGVVFGMLHGVAQGPVVPGNDSYDQRFGHAESGRQLRGVEHTQTAAGARPDVEQSAAYPHAWHDGRGQPLNLWQGPVHGHGYKLVFGIDVGEQLVHALLFQVVVTGFLLGL